MFFGMGGGLNEALNACYIAHHITLHSPAPREKQKVPMFHAEADTARKCHNLIHEMSSVVQAARNFLFCYSAFRILFL